MLSPVRNLVYIKPIFESNTWATETGVLIHKVDQSKSRTTTGVVIETGPLVKEVKRGDKVFYTAYDGQIWAYQDKLFIVMPEDKIIAKWDTSRIFTVAGLYMKDKDGFFEAPYEGVVEFLAKQLEQEDDVQKFNMKEPDPLLYKDTGPPVYQDE